MLKLKKYKLNIHFSLSDNQANEIEQLSNQVDVETLITPLILQLVVAMGMRAQIKTMRITMKDRSNGQFMSDMASHEVLQKKASEDIKEELEQMPPQEGMMARQEPQGVI